MGGHPLHKKYRILTGDLWCADARRHQLVSVWRPPWSAIALGLGSGEAFTGRWCAQHQRSDICPEWTELAATQACQTPSHTVRGWRLVILPKLPALRLSQRGRLSKGNWGQMNLWGWGLRCATKRRAQRPNAPVKWRIQDQNRSLAKSETCRTICLAGWSLGFYLCTL